jgi:hypothetical protein
MRFTPHAQLKDGCALEAEATLALWCFIHPKFLRRAGDALRHVSPSKYKELITKQWGPLEPSAALTEDELVRFAAAMNAEFGGEGSVVLLRQKAGQVVLVPPGWVHCVLNLAPCIKVANDRYIFHCMLRLPMRLGAVSCLKLMPLTTCAGARRLLS